LIGGAADGTQIAEGMGYMIGQQVDVVNLSFGGSHSAVLQSTVAEAHDAGVVVVSSIGNSGPNPGTATCPAHHDTTLSVGSVGPDGTPAGFSSRGPGWDGQTVPEVVAYGGRSEQGDRDQLVTESVLGAAAPSGGQYLVGTSMASPQVAGITALRVGAEQ
jgi:subtilisin family serine protease